MKKQTYIQPNALASQDLLLTSTHLLMRSSWNKNLLVLILPLYKQYYNKCSYYSKVQPYDSIHDSVNTPETLLNPGLAPHHAFYFMHQLQELVFCSFLKIVFSCSFWPASSPCNTAEKAISCLLKRAQDISAFRRSFIISNNEERTRGKYMDIDLERNLTAS